MSGRPALPVVYGDPAHVVVLVESFVRLMALEPAEVLADPRVRRSLGRLDAVVCPPTGEPGAALPAGCGRRCATGSRVMVCEGASGCVTSGGGAS